MAPAYTYHELIRDVRQGRHTSIGCYPLFFLAADGETICPACVRGNLLLIGRATRDGFERDWCIVGCDANWEDPDMVCANCNVRIESAYAEERTDERVNLGKINNSASARIVETQSAARRLK